MYVCISKMVFARRYAVEERSVLNRCKYTFRLLFIPPPPPANIGGAGQCQARIRYTKTVSAWFRHWLRVLGSSGIQVSAHVTTAQFTEQVCSSSNLRGAVFESLTGRRLF
jgi:hypothetical protein